jgi:multiple sugar transport system substrate-binding protein
MSNLYKRRDALKMGLGGLAGMSALGLVACDSNVPPPAPTLSGTALMHLLFWGTATRNKLTNKAVALFQDQNADVMITSQYTTFNNFWGMLDTLVAGGKTPDLVQMDMRYLAKYVKSGLLLDLTQLIYNQTIDLSDFDPLMLDGSKANNSLYGVPLGGNYQCLLYDSVLIDKANIGAIPPTMNWQTFAEYTTELTRALGKNIYGTGDSSGDLSVYEIWVRQRGKELYTVDGKLAFDVQDLADWFDYWAQLRNNKGCVPPAIQALASSASGPATSPLVHGNAVFALPHSNEFEAYQALMKHKIHFLPIPLGAQPGLYFKPSQLISISTKTPYVNEAAQFIDFIINDPNGIKAIGIERGIPGALKAQTFLKPSFTTAQLEEYTFTNAISNSTLIRVKEVLDPPMASQVATIFTNVAGAISSKHTTVSDGAKAFYAEAQKTLA